MTKKDTPSRRLAEIIEYERRQRKVMTNLANIGQGLRDPHPVPGMEADRIRAARAEKLHGLFHKNDEDDNSLLAVAALQIDGAPESLRTAFEKHELDPNEPWAWRELLIRFAHAHYGGGKEVGRPREYDKLQVFEDYAAIRRKHPKSGDEDLFRFMKSSFPHRYKTREAAKKCFNRALNKLRENYDELKMARACKEKDGIQWTPKVAAEVRKQLRAETKSTIAQYWGQGGRDKSRP